MPWISNVTKDWQSAGALTGNEDWMPRDGKVLVTTAAAPTTDEGLLLDPQGERGLVAVSYNTGETVRYRLAPGESAARIWRETRT